MLLIEVGQRLIITFQVTTVKKTITQREVHETIETLSGEKKFSTQESTTPKVSIRSDKLFMIRKLSILYG